MPRVARKDMPGTFYHVMCQGINKEYIFNDDSLKKKYKKILEDKKENCTIKIIAYCIMDNHVHILLNTLKNDDMSKFMHRVNTSYGRYYNKLKNRVGYVFRDRYLSKTINTAAQLQRCLVYIHRNPVVAKMVERECKYKYSSYNEYLRVRDGKNLICDDAKYLAFGTNNNIKFLEQYKYIHGVKDDELVEFDNFENTINNNMEDLLNKYKDLTKEEKIIQLNLNDKISERKLAEIFRITRHQIRIILKKK